MKRTTVMLPDEIATLIDLERKRTDTSVAEIIRRALVRYYDLEGTEPKKLPFVALGRSGYTDTSERMEELLAEGWRKRFERKLGRDRDS